MSLHWDASELQSLAHSLGVAGEQAGARADVAVRAAALQGAALAQASAPVDTGALRSSIGVDLLGAGAAAFGPSVNYGAYVEFGTSRMAPQPYLGPAADAVSGALQQAIEQIAEEALS